MAIKRRPTEEEVLTRRLGDQWQSALHHPVISPLIRFAEHPADAGSVIAQIKKVSGWKGASYRSKVFVFVLASVIWRATGESFLTDARYDRLRKHLVEHEDDVLNKTHLLYYDAFVWGNAELARRYGAGELDLSVYLPKRRKPKKTKRNKPKRKRLRKHKA